MGISQKITDNFDLLLHILPPSLLTSFTKLDLKAEEVLEIILDLGRKPEIRLINDQEIDLADEEITNKDIEYVVQHIGGFDENNRAGIERTLHRISAIRNRKGTIVGLTCRVGRAVYGVIDIMKDIIESGKSILLLGAPGVGKTTVLREAARVLASDLKKRVVVIDTSNEIAGDGDIPHEAIGKARRMQVAAPSLQHQIMIEAVENHMPQVIIIDEIGVEAETAAARTIAERGVQLIGTAHGRSLENLILNPTLVDLIGGIQTVTLSDEEAYRRNTQKSILERMRPPTFDSIVEILGWGHIKIYPDAAAAVDALLAGTTPPAHIRQRDSKGEIHLLENQEPLLTTQSKSKKTPQRQQSDTYLQQLESFYTQPENDTRLSIYLLGISRKKAEIAARNLNINLRVTPLLDEAELIITLKNLYRKRPKKIRKAEAEGLPVYIIRDDSLEEIEGILAGIIGR